MSLSLVNRGSFLYFVNVCGQCAESLARIQAGLINTGNKRERVKILHKKSESNDLWYLSWLTKGIFHLFISNIYTCSHCLTIDYLKDF